jgi:hypothetical protein
LNLEFQQLCKGSCTSVLWQSQCVLRCGYVYIIMHCFLEARRECRDHDCTGVLSQCIAEMTGRHEAYRDAGGLRRCFRRMVEGRLTYPFLQTDGLKPPTGMPRRVHRQLETCCGRPFRGWLARLGYRRFWGVYSSFFPIRSSGSGGLLEQI